MSETLNPCSLNSVGDMNTFVSILIQSLLASQCLISPASFWPPDYANEAIENGLDSYDFVVVGAGTAGSVVASELSENPDWNVLVLEEGGDPPQESEVPSLFYNLQHTEYVENTLIQANQRSCKAFANGQCTSARGKLLGGSGSINGMLYVRGNREDYDRWLAAGNKGWGYDDVWPYFEELVRVVGNESYPEGYLTINEFPQFEENIFQLIYQAAAELDLPHVEDFIEPSYTGYAKVKGTIQNGHRSSTAKTFLGKVSQRPNLNVIKNARVTKINFDAEGKRALSIDFLVQGIHALNVLINKEAIISAGSIGTPHILLLSGVGPKDVLQPLNIPIVRKLPIGQNLQDHVMAGYFMALDAQDHDQTVILDTIYQYLLYNKGALSSHGATSLIGYINTNTTSDSPYPDVGIYHASFRKGDFFGLKIFMKAFSMHEDMVTYFMNAIQSHDILGLYMMCLHPKSRGRVTLHSSSYLDEPLIDTNYLGEQEDLEVLLRGAKYLERLENTTAFRERNAQIMHIPIEECDNYDFKSNDYWRCYISYYTMSGFHYVGTVKMGPMNESASCVNRHLKVKGFDNLRVVDASIMPFITSANTNGPTIMIAKKASDMIKRDWKST